jgi:hypothetical protein
MSTRAPDPKTSKTPPDPRAERLKAALKANIAKRKDQTRARDRVAHPPPDTRPKQD